MAVSERPAYMGAGTPATPAPMSGCQAPAVFRAAKPLAAAAVTAESAKAASERILARAGAKVRDADDLRVIQDVRDRTGRVGRKLAAIS